MEDLGLDVRIADEIFTKLKVSEYCSVFFACYSIALSILLYELPASSSSFLPLYSFISTVCLVLSLFLRYHLTLQLYIARGLLTHYDTLLNIGWWKPLLAETALCLLCPYPGL